MGTCSPFLGHASGLVSDNMSELLLRADIMLVMGKNGHMSWLFLERISRDTAVTNL